MDHLSLLEGEVAAMAAAVRAADPDAPVPACPGWTVRDVVAHTAGVHRWVLAALRSDEPPAYDESVPEGDLAEAYARDAGAMVDALRALPPDHRCWTFDRDNPTAAFWRRRQVHEVAVHRWDVAPYAMTDEVALDGIDEVVHFMLPRQLARGRTTLPAGDALELRAAGRTWHVGEGAPVVVEGTASDVLLRLWGRGEALPPPWDGVALTP